MTDSASQSFESFEGLPFPFHIELHTMHTKNERHEPRRIFCNTAHSQYQVCEPPVRGPRQRGRRDLPFADEAETWLELPQHRVRLQRRFSTRTCEFVRNRRSFALYCSLQNVLQSAFGADFGSVERIKVKAQCRIWRIFFQSRPHAHIELPESLQLPKIE